MYFSNAATGETTWQLPPIPGQQPQLPPLPAGWFEWVGLNGLPFWEHLETGLKSYDRPKDGDHNVEQVYDPSLPEGWQSWRAHQGDRYFLNTLTQHTQWSAPKGPATESIPAFIGRAKPAPPEDADYAFGGDDSVLPEGWVKTQDGSGRPLFARRGQAFGQRAHPNPLLGWLRMMQPPIGPGDLEGMVWPVESFWWHAGRLELRWSRPDPEAAAQLQEIRQLPLGWTFLSRGAAGQEYLHLATGHVQESFPEADEIDAVLAGGIQGLQMAAAADDEDQPPSYDEDQPPSYDEFLALQAMR